MASKPDRSPGKNWETEGFTTVEPADPSANLGDSDILRGNGRESLMPDRAKDSQKFQRGDIKPLKTDLS